MKPKTVGPCADVEGGVVMTCLRLQSLPAAMMSQSVVLMPSVYQEGVGYVPITGEGPVLVPLSEGEGLLFHPLFLCRSPRGL